VGEARVTAPVPGEPEHVTRLGDALSILETFERGPNRSTPRWADLGTPVIDNGSYAIYPLAVADLPEGGDLADPGLLVEMLRWLEQACIHFHGGGGFHAESHVDLDEGYGRKLLDAGAIVPGRMFWWRFGYFGALLVRAVDEKRTQETLALHVVPDIWVWDDPPAPSTKRAASRHRRLLRERDAVPVAHLVWSWPLPGDQA
jgi:hypothetical protein